MANNNHKRPTGPVYVTD